MCVLLCFFSLGLAHQWRTAAPVHPFHTRAGSDVSPAQGTTTRCAGQPDRQGCADGTGCLCCAKGGCKPAQPCAAQWGEGQGQGCCWLVGSLCFSLPSLWKRLSTGWGDTGHHLVGTRWLSPGDAPAVVVSLYVAERGWPHSDMGLWWPWGRRAPGAADAPGNAGTYLRAGSRPCPSFCHPLPAPAQLRDTQDGTEGAVCSLGQSAGLGCLLPLHPSTQQVPSWDLPAPTLMRLNTNAEAAAEKRPWDCPQRAQPGTRRPGPVLPLWHVPLAGGT